MGSRRRRGDHRAGEGPINAGFGVDPQVGRHPELYADEAQLSSGASEDSDVSIGKPPADG